MSTHSQFKKKKNKVRKITIGQNLLKRENYETNLYMRFTRKKFSIHILNRRKNVKFTDGVELTPSWYCEGKFVCFTS